MNNKKDVEWEAKQSSHWKNRRELNYPELSLDDLGIVYDILSAVLDALDKKHINVKLGDGDKAKLDHRNLVKERIPKEGK